MLKSYKNAWEWTYALMALMPFQLPSQPHFPPEFLKEFYINIKPKHVTNFILHNWLTYLKQWLCSNANLALCIVFTYCCRWEFGLLILITMGRKKRRSKISTRNQSDTEEIREKYGEIKRKKRAILRGEEVANQAMIGRIKCHC